VTAIARYLIGCLSYYSDKCICVTGTLLFQSVSGSPVIGPSWIIAWAENKHKYL